MGVEQGAALLSFADAAVRGPGAALAAARAELVDVLGTAAMLDAAAVIAVFDGITRIADATGIPLEEYKERDSAEWRGPLGIDAFVARKS